MVAASSKTKFDDSDDDVSAYLTKAIINMFNKKKSINFSRKFVSWCVFNLVLISFITEKFKIISGGGNREGIGRGDV